MNTIYLLAILTFTVAHIIRGIRWCLILPKTSSSTIFKPIATIGISSIINFFLPLRVGDVVKALIIKKWMKLPLLVVIASLILEALLDIIAVLLIYICINFFIHHNFNITINLLIYLSIFIFSICLIIFLKRYVKLIIFHLSTIFSAKVSYYILLLFFEMTSMAKVMLYKVKYIILTILMWGCYFLSIYFYCLWDKTISYINLFDISYSAEKNTYLSLFNTILNYPSWQTTYLTSFFLLPSIIILLGGIVFYKSKNLNYIFSKNNYQGLYSSNYTIIHKYLLDYYLSSNNSFKELLAVIKNGKILNNLSGGSNAITLLVTESSNTIIRKIALYSSNQDALEKLKSQYEWLKENENEKYIAKVIKQQENNNFYYFDMEYYLNIISFFDYMHREDDINKSVEKLIDLSNFVKNTIHNKQKNICSNQAIEQYYLLKYEQNITLLLTNKILLNKSGQIIINGIKYKNLLEINKWFNLTLFKSVLTNTYCGNMHGDLSIGNILYNGDNLFLIDPNYQKEDKHNFQLADYAKLRQSLHMGYEFLLLRNSKVASNLTFKTDNDSIYNIEFDNIISHKYVEIHHKLVKYFKDIFTTEEIKAIELHEIICYSRIIPYRLDNPNELLLTIAIMLILQNNFYEKYNR